MKSFFIPKIHRDKYPRRRRRRRPPINRLYTGMKFRTARRGPTQREARIYRRARVIGGGGGGGWRIQKVHRELGQIVPLIPGEPVDATSSVTHHREALFMNYLLRRPTSLHCIEQFISISRCGMKNIRIAALNLSTGARPLYLTAELSARNIFRAPRSWGNTR